MVDFAKSREHAALACVSLTVLPGRLALSFELLAQGVAESLAIETAHLHAHPVCLASKKFKQPRVLTVLRIKLHERSLSQMTAKVAWKIEFRKTPFLTIFP